MGLGTFNTLDRSTFLLLLLPVLLLLLLLPVLLAAAAVMASSNCAQLIILVGVVAIASGVKATGDNMLGPSMANCSVGGGCRNML